MQFSSNKNKIDIEISKSGDKCLKIENTYLHSKYNPINEAEKWASQIEISNNKIIFVFGLGLGYHIDSLLDKLSNIPDNNILIVIIEPDENIYNITKENNIKLWDKLSNHKHKFIIGINDVLSKIYKIISELSISNFSGFQIECLRNWYNLYTELHDYLSANIATIIKEYIANGLTTLELQRLWFKHFFYNIPVICDKSTINDIKYNNTNNPVLLISAGASLRKSLDIIEKYKDKLSIICVDTALLPLLQKNICPDIVVSLDSQIHNYKDFFSINEYLNNQDTNYLLACDITIYPTIIRSHKGKTIVFSSDTDSSQYKLLVDTYKNLANQHENIELSCGGSVSTSALDLAIKLGFRDIFFVGQDLGYLPGLTHSPGCPSYNKRLFNSNKYRTPFSETYTYYSRRNVTINKNKNDELIYNDLAMTNLKNWIERYIKIAKNEYKNVNFYQLNSVGLDIKDSTQIDNTIFEKLISQLNSIKPSFNEIKNTQKANQSNVYKNIEAILNKVKEFYILFNSDENLNNILNHRETLCEKYPIIKIYYEKDDLYYNRLGKTRNNDELYLDLLQISTLKLIKIFEQSLTK